MLIFQDTFIWVPFVIVMFVQLIMMTGLPARIVALNRGLSAEQKEENLRRSKVFLFLHGFFGLVFVICLAIFLELFWRDLNAVAIIVLFIGVLVAFFGFRLIFSGRVVAYKIDKK